MFHSVLNKIVMARILRRYNILAQHNDILDPKVEGGACFWCQVSQNESRANAAVKNVLPALTPKQQYTFWIVIATAPGRRHTFILISYGLIVYIRVQPCENKIDAGSVPFYY